MLRVGLVGVGFMGQNHFNMWQLVAGAQVVAVADKLPERVAVHTPALGGNVGEAKPLDFSQVGRYPSLEAMLGEADLDCVDVCTPTDLHAQMTVQALEAGRHVISEKPMALSVAQCDRMIAAAQASGRQLFVAQCIRFWPAYEVLAQWVAEGRLGKLVAARFTRLSGPPTWGAEGWLLDPARSGGATLDLHVHDSDFLLSVWGMPRQVSSTAANLETPGDKVDHIVTSYTYPGGFVCVAEGGWVMPPASGFEMSYWVLGAAGMLQFSSSQGVSPVFHPYAGESQTIEVSDETGYSRELAYFAECMGSGRQPDRVPPESSRDAIRLVLAERQSANRGQPVVLS